MEKDPLYLFIKKVVAKVAELPEKDVLPDSHFQDDLEIDSLEAVEILHKIEKKYKVKLKGVDLENVKTTSVMYQICRERINQKS